MPSVQEGESYASVYVCMGLFLCTMASLAIYGFITQRHYKAKLKEAGGDVRDAELHFVGARDFGVFVLYANTVATFVSGFVLMQVPEEASHIGFITLMYMGGCNNCGFLMNITWPRFRRIFVNRDYQGPSDMISDRYNSLTLRLMSSFASCFFMVFFLAIEWQIVAAVVPGMTGGSLNGKTVVFFLATFVLICEFVGGMTSVALTDAIQMTIMGCSFVVMFFSCVFYFGGFAGTVPYHCSNYKADIAINGTCRAGLTAVNCNTAFPAAFSDDSGTCSFCAPFGLATSFGDNLKHLGNNNTLTTFAELQYSEDSSDHFIYCSGCTPAQTQDYTFTETGCIAHTMQWMMTYPPMNLAMVMFNVHFLFIGIMIARDDEALKKMFTPLHFFPVCFFFPPIMLGIIRTAMWPDVAGHGFTVALYQIMKINVWFQGLGALLVTSAVAAFMSTSDSLVLAASNMVTMDVWKNLIVARKPHLQKDTYTLMFSKVFSVLIMYLAVWIALYSGWDIGQLLLLGFGTITQNIPAYAFGVFFNVHSKPLIAGLAVGMFTCYYVEVVLFPASKLATKNDPYTDGENWLFSFMWGIILNVSTVLVGEFLIMMIKASGADAPWLFDDHAPARQDSWDAIPISVKKQYGKEPLTKNLIQTFMDGTVEPVLAFLPKKRAEVRWHWCMKWIPPLMLFGVVVIVNLLAVPWWKEVRVDLGVSSAANNGFVEDDVVAGMPSWAFRYCALLACSTTLLSLSGEFGWRTEDDPEMIEKYGDHKKDHLTAKALMQLELDCAAQDSSANSNKVKVVQKSANQTEPIIAVAEEVRSSEAP